MEHFYSKSSQKMARLLFLSGLLSLLCACPSYEDSFSGTYVEVRENALSEELLVIDYFRFGYYSNAIVRSYRVPQSVDPEDLLNQPISCVWTQTGDAPKDDGTWRLSLDESTIKGTFLDDDNLTIQIEEFNEDGVLSSSSHTLRRYNTIPNNACNVVQPVPLVASFNLKDAVNTMPQGQEYTLRQPVFAMLWAGVSEKTLSNGTIVYAATNNLTNEVYLADETYVDREQNALHGSLSYSMNPPPTRALATSGDTRYALAHFIVVDDSCDEEPCPDTSNQRFDWDIKSEPIIASSIELGNEPDSPFPNAIGLGKALLFVEGSLADLNPNFKNLIINLDTFVEQRAESHFYVLDIFFDEDLKIIGLRLPQEPNIVNYRSAKLKISPTFLGNTQIQLPRLSPSFLQ